MNRNENSLSYKTKNNYCKIHAITPVSLSLSFPEPLSHPSPPPSHFLNVLSSNYSIICPSFPPSTSPMLFSQGKLIFSTFLSSLQTFLPPSLPLPPPSNSHMASWFSQDIADFSSSSDSLLEGRNEAHEQCVTARLHEHRLEFTPVKIK